MCPTFNLLFSTFLKKYSNNAPCLPIWRPITEQVGVAVKLQTCVQEVNGSNLGQVIA